MNLEKVTRARFRAAVADNEQRVEARRSSHIEYRIDGELVAVSFGTRQAGEQPAFYVPTRRRV